MKLIIAWGTAIVAILSLAATAGAGETISRVSDGDVELVVQVDKQTAQVVEPIELSLTLTAPVGSLVTLPEPSGQLGAFQVQRVAAVADLPDPTGAGKRTWNVRIVLDTLQSGAMSIPPLDVQYRVPSGDAFRTLSSEPVEIQVVSLLEDRSDPTDFRDIKTVVDVAVPREASRAWIGWLTGAAGVLCAVATWVVVASRRRKVISAGDWALSEIEQLEQVIEAEPSTADSVFSELTMIIHDFVELQYGDSVGPPTRGARFDEPAGDSRVPESLRHGFSEFMSLADEVKFAQRSVCEDQVRRSIEQAKAWVRSCVEQVALQTKEAA